MQKLTPFIWFVDDAEEAIAFYTSLLPDTHLDSVTKLGNNVPGPEGKTLMAAFTLLGRPFMALNGGPVPSSMQGQGRISLTVLCDTQEEIDRLWDAFSEGGHPIQCGWITDRFGITWQITPSIMGELMGDPDPVKAKRTADAMMKMVKLDIAALQAAHDGV